MDALKLSPEQLQQMTSALHLTDANYSGPEKRRSQRIHAATPVTIIPCGGRGNRRPIKVTLLNISDSGVAIQDPPPLKRGDQFVLRLPPTDSQALSAMLCTVVYSRLMADGCEVVGAQFNRVLTVPALQSEADGHSREERDHLNRLEQRLMAARDQQHPDPESRKSDA